jgi:hypothetical protein
MVAPLLKFLQSSKNFSQAEQRRSRSAPHLTQMIGLSIEWSAWLNFFTQFVNPF